MNNSVYGSLSKKDLLEKVGHMSQLASIRPCELTEGRSAGVKAYSVSTGSGLEFTVLGSKCLDIYEMKYRGVNLSFISKPGLHSPQYFSMSDPEFLRNFQAGMLYTCGLSNIGTGSTDENSYFNIHGRISHAPSENTSIHSCWEGDEYLMKISGEMREAAHFLENLILNRTISTSFNSKKIIINDYVENQGFEKQPVMLMYHFNFGYPILDEGSRFIVSQGEITPRTQEAAEHVSDYTRIDSPVSRFKEHVFYHEAHKIIDGYAYAALINDRLGLGVYIKYRVDELPVLVQWKNLGSGDYALGIEPSSNRLEGRADEREKGTLKYLDPLERRNFEVEIGVLDGADEISAFERKLKN